MGINKIHLNMYKEEIKLVELQAKNRIDSFDHAQHHRKGSVMKWADEWIGFSVMVDSLKTVEIYRLQEQIDSLTEVLKE